MHVAMGRQLNEIAPNLHEVSLSDESEKSWTPKKENRVGYFEFKVGS